MSVIERLPERRARRGGRDRPRAHDDPRRRDARRPPGHVQRQPAGHGRRRGGADADPDPRRVPATAENAARLNAGCQQVIDDFGLPAYSVNVGPKGCVMFTPARGHQLPRLRRARLGAVGGVLLLPGQSRRAAAARARTTSGRCRSRTRPTRSIATSRRSAISRRS